MRLFTLCYGLMTVSLGSVLFYGIASAHELRSPFGSPSVFTANLDGPDNPIVINGPTPASATSVAPAHVPMHAPAHARETTGAAVPATPAARAPGEALAVSAGMSFSDVRAVLGEPDAISDDGARWTYGSNILIFNEEALAGQVQYDPIQAAMNKYNNMLAFIGDESGESDAAAGNGPKAVHRGSSSPKAMTRYQYRPIPAGSARDAYRFNYRNQEYSYYMNRAGPMDRVFLRKPSLPRGMSSQYDRNMGRSYSRFGSTTRYGVNPNIAYRR
jgi:hypothetical protein